MQRQCRSNRCTFISAKTTAGTRAEQQSQPGEQLVQTTLQHILNADILGGKSVKTGTDGLPETPASAFQITQ